jgi:hypothetical protein
MARGAGTTGHNPPQRSLSCVRHVTFDATASLTAGGGRRMGTFLTSLDTVAVDGIDAPDGLG